MSEDISISRTVNRVKMTRSRARGKSVKRPVRSKPVKSISAGPGKKRIVQVRRKTPSGKRKTPKKVGMKKPKKSTKKPIRISRPGSDGAGAGETPPELLWVEEDPKDHLLSRFIYDSKDQLVGESIGVEGKRLIMKNGLKFYSIPLKNIKERETDLTLSGNINRKRARKLGEVWRKKALDPLYQKKK